MTRTPLARESTRLRTVAVAYIVVAFVGTAALLTAISEKALPHFAVLLWLFYLGPIGIIAAVFSAFTDFSLGAPGLAAFVVDAVVTLLFTGAASLNVLAMRRLRRSDRTRTDAQRSGYEHRLASGLFFAFAGAAFVLLSLAAGFLFLVAYGVDTPTPDPLRIRLQSVAAVSWSVGLVAAIAGLVIWVRGLAHHRPTLRFAVVDLVVVVALTAVVVVNSSVGLE